MNNKFKRLLAVLFSLSMVFCLMSANAWAKAAGPTVAKIGDTPYDNLQDAFNAAQDNQTIVLHQSVKLEASCSRVQVNGTLTSSVDNLNYSPKAANWQNPRIAAGFMPKYDFT